MLPLKEGVSGVKRVQGDEAAGPALQRIKSGATLKDLKQDYEMFTYAPLFLYGGLEHNPVQEWINLNNHKQIVFILALDDPFIRTGGPSRWDRTLWLVEKPYWNSLSLHIGSMAILNRKMKQLTRVVCQELDIPDVVAIAKGIATSLQSVPITTFSIDSNLGCIAFAPGTVLTQWRPQLKLYTARDETVKLANAMLLNQPNPYLGLQTPPWEKPDEDPNPST